MPTSSTSKANIERLAAEALAKAIKAGHARGGPSSPKTRRNRRQTRRNRRQTRRNRHQTRRN